MLHGSGQLQSPFDQDIYADLAGDVKKKFTSTHPTVNSKDYYPKEKQKRIRLMKDEFGEKITKGFVDLRPKTYSYLTDGGCISKNANSTKKCVIKQEINFEDCKRYLTI